MMDWRRVVCTDYAVINHDEIVDTVGNASVADIIDMCCKVVARLPFGYERAQFYILNSYLLYAQLVGHDIPQSLRRKRRRSETL